MAKGEWKRITALVNAASDILEQQQPMTIRQLFYRLVSQGLIPNDRKHYQLVSRIMTKARDDGRIPFEYITDRSRPEYKPNVFDDAEQYANTVRNGYRKDYWNTQPCHVELWVEKDAIIGSIQGVTDELGITTRVGRGFLSTTRAHEIADYFDTLDDKEIHVFYLGDHDPSGLVIESDLEKRITNYGTTDFLLKRLAIFKTDIQDYNLPPLRIKQTDTNAAGFERKYGSDCVELDALPPDVLRERIKTAVEDLIDFESWNQAQSTEEAEFDSIKETVAVWKNLKVQTQTDVLTDGEGI